MAESVHLIGAEEVGSAGHRIATAAESMRQTASYFEQSLQGWLLRFEELVERLELVEAKAEKRAAADLSDRIEASRVSTDAIIASDEVMQDQLKRAATDAKSLFEPMSKGLEGPQVDGPQPDVLLKPREVSERLNVTIHCLDAWRQRGQGPQFVRISARCIRYRESDLAAYIEGLEVSA